MLKIPSLFVVIKTLFGESISLFLGFCGAVSLGVVVGGWTLLDRVEAGRVLLEHRGFFGFVFRFVFEDGGRGGNR